MESRDGADRSSSRESDRQMGSEGDRAKAGRPEVGAVEGGVAAGRERPEVRASGAFWIQRPSWRGGGHRKTWRRDSTQPTLEETADF